MLTDNGDLRSEVSRVRGAVVVKRPELTARPGILTPANGLDFVETLRSYFSLFRSSLFPRYGVLDTQPLVKAVDH